MRKYLQIYVYDMGQIFKIYIYFKIYTKQQQNPQIAQLKIWSKDLNSHFPKNIYTNGQVVHEKMLNIANHHRHASQNHNEVLHHIC